MLISELPADIQTFRREIERHIETIVLVANTPDWAIHEADVILSLCHQADEKWPDFSLAWGHFKAAATMRRAIETERKKQETAEARPQDLINQHERRRVR